MWMSQTVGMTKTAASSCPTTARHSGSIRHLRRARTLLRALRPDPHRPQVHVIFLTESEGTWSYAIQQTTIVDNHVSVFDDPNAFIETDTDGLIAAIDALP